MVSDFPASDTDTTERHNDDASLKARKIPRWFRRLLISVIVLVMGWTAIWFGYAYFLERQANAFFMATEQADQTPPLRSEDRWITGYPFGWYLHFDKPQITNPETASRFSADHAWVGFHLRNFRQINWETSGNIEAAMPVPTNNPAMPIAQMTVTAEQAEGFFTLSDLGPRDPHFTFGRVLLALGPLNANGSPPVPLDDDTISLDQEPAAAPPAPNPFGRDLPSVNVETINLAMLSPVWPPTKAGDPALTVKAALNGIQGNLPAATMRMPLDAVGQGVDQFHFTLTLTGPLPQGVHAFALGQWRDNGGAVALDHLYVQLGDVELHGSGSGLLDTALQPALRVEMEVKGHETLLERLVAEGTIQQLMADFTRQMLRPLVSQNTAGDDVLAVTLGIRDRWLMVGPMQLLRVPPVQWAGSSQ